MSACEGEERAMVHSVRTPRRRALTPRAMLSRTLSYLFLVTFSLIIAYPIFWMFIQSLKATSEMYNNVWGMPKGFRWINYQNAWEMADIGRYIFNSFLVSISTVLMILVVASLAAYAFSKMEFWGNRAVYYVFVLSLMLPVPIIPLYSVVSKLKLMNTYFALILPYAAGGLPMSIFLLRPFFDSIPGEIEDAARIDGCTSLRTFIQIVLPLSRPGLATIVIFQFMNAWNEYFQALIFIRKNALRTIPIGLQGFFQEHSTDWPELFAALSMVTIPVIVIYVLMQKQFIAGLTAGAIKV